MTFLRWGISQPIFVSYLRPLGVISRPAPHSRINFLDIKETQAKNRSSYERRSLFPSSREEISREMTKREKVQLFSFTGLRLH